MTVIIMHVNSQTVEVMHMGVIPTKVAVSGILAKVAVSENLISTHAGTVDMLPIMICTLTLLSDHYSCYTLCFSNS